MVNIKKAAPQTNAKAANIKQLQRHFTEVFQRIKLKFVRLASWLALFPH